MIMITCNDLSALYLHYLKVLTGSHNLWKISASTNLPILFWFCSSPRPSAQSVEFACNAGSQGSIPGLGRSPGGENGNPLQYSCLENPMDRGVRWATVHGVTRVGYDLATKPPPPPRPSGLIHKCGLKEYSSLLWALRWEDTTEKNTSKIAWPPECRMPWLVLVLFFFFSN